MNRTVARMQRANLHPAHPAHGPVHHAETEMKRFWLDTYHDGVRTFLKVSVGLGMLKVHLLSSLFHPLGDVGKEYVMEAAPAYVTSAPTHNGAV
jgi:hypothetical protein